MWRAPTDARDSYFVLNQPDRRSGRSDHAVVHRHVGRVDLDDTDAGNGDPPIGELDAVPKRIPDAHITTIAASGRRIEDRDLMSVDGPDGPHVLVVCRGLISRDIQ
jgi:hypothetical protein